MEFDPFNHDIHRPLGDGCLKEEPSEEEFDDFWSDVISEASAEECARLYVEQEAHEEAEDERNLEFERAPERHLKKKRNRR